MTCSGDQKVTIMVLKVDLQCRQCYKKVKKILSKIPQIRDQIYDEKQNTVTITVVCCSPEKIIDKLCCKGRKSIKSIEIKKPANSTAPKPTLKPAVPTTAPKPATKPVAPAQAPTPVAQWVPSYTPNPPAQVYPVSACCSSCYEGRPGGSYYQGGYGPAPGYEYQYGRPMCSPVYYGSRCDYFTENNPSSCSIM